MEALPEVQAVGVAVRKVVQGGALQVPARHRMLARKDGACQHPGSHLGLRRRGQLLGGNNQTTSSVLGGRRCRGQTIIAVRAKLNQQPTLGRTCIQRWLAIPHGRRRVKKNQLPSGGNRESEEATYPRPTGRMGFHPEIILHLRPLLLSLGDGQDHPQPPGQSSSHFIQHLLQPPCPRPARGHRRQGVG